jgi:hypothetical protein
LPYTIPIAAFGNTAAEWIDPVVRYILMCIAPPLIHTVPAGS